MHSSWTCCACWRTWCSMWLCLALPLCLTLHLFFFFFPIFLIVCVGQQPWHDLACDVELTGVTLQSMQCVADTEANIYAPELDIYGLVFYPSLRTWLHLSLLLWKTVTEHPSRLQKQTLAKMWRDCWDNTSHRRLIHDPMFGGCGLMSLRSL